MTLTKNILEAKLERLKDERMNALKNLAIDFRFGKYIGFDFDLMKEKVSAPYDNKIKNVETRLAYTSENEWN